MESLRLEKSVKVVMIMRKGIIALARGTESFSTFIQMNLGRFVTIKRAKRKDLLSEYSKMVPLNKISTMPMGRKLVKTMASWRTETSNSVSIEMGSVKVNFKSSR